MTQKICVSRTQRAGEISTGAPRRNALSTMPRPTPPGALASASKQLKISRAPAIQAIPDTHAPFPYVCPEPVWAKTAVSNVIRKRVVDFFCHACVHTT